MKHCICLLLAALLLLGCTSEQTPDSIQKIVIRSTGPNAAEVFIVLQNSDDIPVAASGRCFININSWLDPSRYEKLWIGDKQVSVSNFKLYPIGEDGDEVLAFSTGLIPYSEFKHPPVSSSEVEVWVTFDTNGKELKQSVKMLIN